ncbi:MAG: nucleotide exchange factor GrpE [Desulfobulbaceae bacterium]|nr:nucleotide exchange factor GrpE [Desulfobulbaceae bacterium]
MWFFFYLIDVAARSRLCRIECTFDVTIQQEEVVAPRKKAAVKKEVAEKKNISVEEESEEIPLEEEAAVAEEAPEEHEEDGDTLEKCREETVEIQDKLLRLAAEFENYKKRMDREKSTALKFAEENILKELLPSLDNLERAVEQGRNTDDIAVLQEGVEMIMDNLLSVLKKFGLEPVASQGEPFDPNFHEAMVMEASSEVPENHVLQEFQKGYMLKDRLIRAAKVVVSKGDTEE